MGVNVQDVEAARPWAAGLIVREISRRVSNWRAGQSLPDYMRQHNLPGLTDIDTRALVRHIRSQGAMMAALAADPDLSADDLVDMARAAPSMKGLDLAKEVTCSEAYHWETGRCFGMANRTRSGPARTLQGDHTMLWLMILVSNTISSGC